MDAERADFGTLGISLGSILGAIWGSLGFRACFLGFPVRQDQPGCILGLILDAKWEPTWVQTASKIDPKIYEISSSFLNEIWIANWSQNGPGMLPKIYKNRRKNHIEKVLKF